MTIQFCINIAGKVSSDKKRRLTMRNGEHIDNNMPQIIDTVLINGKYVDRSYIRSMAGLALSAAAIIGSAAAFIGLIIF